MIQNEDEEIDEFAEEISSDVERVPNDAADPDVVVKSKIPKEIRDKYEILSYRNAAVILSETRKAEFREIVDTLVSFSITKNMIRRAGGNESDIPKIFSERLRPLGWHETIVQADLNVKLAWKEQVGIKKNGKPKFETRRSEKIRKRFLGGHKIDYVKDRVAFDLEWNSKDQTFDRDLYAFNTFFLSGIVDVGILVTRGESFSPFLKTLGQALTRQGKPEFKKDGKTPRLTHEKYGPSTTWWGKLVYRLNAGRNGGCPVLAVGITPNCVSDLKKKN
jgi:hypothetical protein